MQQQDIPYGYCKCGCGQKTKLANRSSTEKGWLRGEPLDYVNGHNRRRHTFGYRVDAAGCWVWLGSLTWNGYGQGKHQGKGILAHRWYYEQANGPIPQGMQLDHLFEIVTPAENQHRGNRTLLTIEEVKEIKATPRYRGSGAELAQRFGVSDSTISAIRHGRLWVDP